MALLAAQRAGRFTTGRLADARHERLGRLPQALSEIVVLTEG